MTVTMTVMTGEPDENTEVVRLEVLKGCARCAGEHQQLDFLRLTIPSGNFTHWALCPSICEPILMQITVDP